MIADVEQAIRDYLPKTVHMSLGTSRDGQPWVCEVHYAYDDELNLYFRSTAARRHSQEIADNPRVAGNIVVQFGLGEAVRGIYFEGTAQQLTDAAEREQLLPLFEKQLGAKPEILEDAANPEGHQFYKITVGTYYVFDTQDSKPSQKYELKWKVEQHG